MIATHRRNLQPFVRGTKPGAPSARAAALCVAGAMSAAAAGGDARSAAEEASGEAPAALLCTPKRKRKELPRIDLDRSIEEAKEAMKKASKAMLDARAAAKNERRKKARLLKKAAALSPADLERIAVLKRCGLWDPNLGPSPAAAKERQPGTEAPAPVLTGSVAARAADATECHTRLSAAESSAPAGSSPRDRRMLPADRAPDADAVAGDGEEDRERDDSE